MSRRNRLTTESTQQFSFALGIAAASGFAGLAHELLWTRRMIDLLGASSDATSRVFGCFFLGLAIGAALAARWTRRIGRPWRAVAIVEASVAVLALPIALLPYWTGWIWPTLGPDALAGWAGKSVKTVISMVVVLPPATGMGMALPFLAAAVLGREKTLGRHGVWLYGINTLGGVAGLTLVGCVLLPSLGGTDTFAATIGLNLLIAAFCLCLDRRFMMPASPRVDVSTAASPLERRKWCLVLLVAFVSGWGVLAFEVLALHLVMLAAPITYFSPAAVLTTVILVLGLAALATPWLIARIGNARQMLALTLMLTGLGMAITPPWFLAIAKSMPLGPQSSLPLFWTQICGVTLATLGPALFLAGFVFPATLSWLDELSGSSSQAQWAWLLAVNGLGGVCGAELTQRVLMPIAGIHAGIGVVAIFYGCAAVISIPWKSISWTQCACATGTLVFAGWMTFGPLAGLPQLNPHLALKVLEQKTGPEGTVAVVEGQKWGRAILMNNQYILGGTNAKHDQARQALLPLLLHAKPRHVGFIGLATGITPGAALDTPEVERVTAAELSPLVRDAAEHWFAVENKGIINDSRSRVLIEDGRTFFASATEEFDVVVGDLYLPWGLGEARLYSVEHFQSVHHSLHRGGLFCQWLPMYQLTDSQFQSILASFQQVFSKVHLWRVNLGDHHPMLGLVGFRDAPAGVDWRIVESRCHLYREAGIPDPFVRHLAGVEMLYLGPWQPTPRSPTNTLNNLLVEISASQERVTGNPARKYFFGARWLLCVRRLQHAGQSDISRASTLRAVGTQITELGILRRNDQRLSGRMRERAAQLEMSVKSNFPAELLADRAAEWHAWPAEWIAKQREDVF